MQGTRTLKTYPSKRPVASGLRSSVTRRLYLFTDRTRMTIGSARECDIRVDEPYISTIHAVLEYRDGAMWLTDKSRHMTTFIDGWYMGKDPVALLVGMKVQFGHTEFSATDADGAIPVLAASQSELSTRASEQYGSDRLAATYTGKSHSTIARHIRRYKARMMRRWRNDK